MNTAEILKKVRQIEIKTGRIVSETFQGAYHSIFKGRGIEFSEVREYVHGDDIRSIDWNVTARFGKPFVKRYIEERELTIMILCDISGSQLFGTMSRFKIEAASELAATFAFSAMKNNDKTGLLLFTDKIELFIPPRKGQRHVLRIIRELIAHQPHNNQTDIANALVVINKLLKRKGILVLISDFMASDFEDSVKRSAQKHDLIPVIIEDKMERNLPNLDAVFNFEDMEQKNETFMLDLSSEKFISDYEKNMSERKQKLEKLFKSIGIDWIEIQPDKPIFDPVIKFFKRRGKKLKL
ncbi:MAG: DUF58 domain-containing protein [Elusimicrobiota bacterium]